MDLLDQESQWKDDSDASSADQKEQLEESLESLELAKEEPAAEEFELPTLDTGSPEAEHEDDRAWYVVHCYSGYENKVRHNLEQRIESMGMKYKIFDVVVPT